MMAEYLPHSNPHKMGFLSSQNEYLMGRAVFYVGLMMGLLANYYIADAFHEYVRLLSAVRPHRPQDPLPQLRLTGRGVRTPGQPQTHRARTRGAAAVHLHPWHHWRRHLRRRPRRAGPPLITFLRDRFPNVSCERLLR